MPHCPLPHRLPANSTPHPVRFTSLPPPAALQHRLPGPRESSAAAGCQRSAAAQAFLLVVLALWGALTFIAPLPPDSQSTPWRAHVQAARLTCCQATACPGGRRETREPGARNFSSPAPKIHDCRFWRGVPLFFPNSARPEGAPASSGARWPLYKGITPLLCAPASPPPPRCAAL